MKLVFDRNDMIEFVKWYDSQDEDSLKRTFEEDFNCWLSLQNTSSNIDYAKCLQELKAQVKWNGWEDPYITDILKKYFA